MALFQHTTSTSNKKKKRLDSSSVKETSKVLCERCISNVRLIQKSQRKTSRKGQWRGTLKQTWDAATRAFCLSTAWPILEITVQHFYNYLCLFISIVLMENLISGQLVDVLQKNLERFIPRGKQRTGIQHQACFPVSRKSDIAEVIKLNSSKSDGDLCKPVSTIKGSST